jgi:hypothetical protein
MRAGKIDDSLPSMNPNNFPGLSQIHCKAELAIPYRGLVM